MNEDMEPYSKKTDSYIESKSNRDNPVPQQEYDIKDKIIEHLQDKVESQNKVIDDLSNTLQGPPKIMSGKDCEVLNYSTWTDRRAVHIPGYHAVVDGVIYAKVITEQKASVGVKNKFGMHRWVKDFIIVAQFRDGSRQETSLKPTQGDSSSSQIPSHGTYDGFVKFENEEPIVSLGCRVNPGL